MFAVGPTLAELISAITGGVSTLVPDLGVFLAAGVVLGLAVLAGKRIIKAGR